MMGALALAGATIASLRPSSARSRPAWSRRSCSPATGEPTSSSRAISSFRRSRRPPGIKVKLVVGTALSNYRKVVATRNNPEIDVYWSNELTHAAGKQQGLYDKLDPRVVTNLVDVYESVDGSRRHRGRQPRAGHRLPVQLAGLPGCRHSAAHVVERPVSIRGSRARSRCYTFNVAFSQDLVVLLTKVAGGTEKDVRPGLEQAEGAARSRATSRCSRRARPSSTTC